MAEEIDTPEQRDIIFRSIPSYNAAHFIFYFRFLQLICGHDFWAHKSMNKPTNLQLKLQMNLRLN